MPVYGFTYTMIKFSALYLRNKYSIEVGFATGNGKVSEFFVYISPTSVVMQLMT
jgi:hypothetical protein